MADDQEVKRDAGTGQFVSEEYAEAHPDTTVGHTIKWYSKEEVYDIWDSIDTTGINTIYPVLVEFAKALGVNVRED
jgi:hypothetical protein